MIKDCIKIDNSFIKENEKLIYYALCKDYPWIVRDEDLLQEARIWLLEAKQLYDSKRGASWRTFASNIIKQRYNDSIKKNKKSRFNLENNGYSSVGLDAINENDIYNSIDQNKGKSIDDELEAKYIYNYCLDNIKDEDVKDIVKMRLEGADFRTIAYKHRISKQWANVLYTKSISRLLKILKNDKWLKDFDIKVKESIKYKIDVNKINELRLQGYKWKDICKEIHINFDTLYKYIDFDDYPKGRKEV
jgi:RNA polymerase sigma factor (sigma-70 family)